MNDTEWNNDSLLRVNEAAEVLSVSKRTVWRMSGDGQLRAVRFRRCTRLAYTDVAAYCERRRGGGRP